jgi:hypothetical protein
MATIEDPPFWEQAHETRNEAVEKDQSGEHGSQSTKGTA